MRTNRLRLTPDKEQQDTLGTLGDRASALWNVANYRCRQTFFAGRRVPGYSALCAELKMHEAYRDPPSDVAQEVLKKVSEAWKSYFELVFPKIPGSSRDAVEAAAVRAPPKPDTRRWTIHRWVDASNPLGTRDLRRERRNPLPPGRGGGQRTVNVVRYPWDTDPP